MNQPAERTKTSQTDTAGRPERLAGYLDRARSGEAGALQEIVREMTPLLWHVARTQGLSAEQAADVVQTTWLELLRRLNEIRSPQALAGWLTTATRHEAWRIMRQERKQAGRGDDVEAEAVADPAPQAADRLIAGERQQVLIRHFGRLSQRCQSLLRVVAETDRPSYAMVSEALGMPPGSIGPTRGRCLARLRDMLLADPQWSVS